MGKLKDSLGFELEDYYSSIGDFSGVLAEVNGLVFDSYDAYELLLATRDEQQMQFEAARGPDGNFPTVQHELWFEYNRIVNEQIKKGGSNLQFIGNYCIVFIYQVWDETVREQLARLFDVKKNEIRNEVFGDIRNFRNAIVHNKSIATTAVENNSRFRWYRHGDPINVDKEKYLEISQAIVGTFINHELMPEKYSELAHFLRKMEDEELNNSAHEISQET